MFIDELNLITFFSFFQQSNSLRDFDDRFTSKTFGYRDHVEYYTAANLSQQPLHKINTPTLFLNAFDDPFAPGHSKYNKNAVYF